MKPTLLFLGLGLASASRASWFGSQSQPQFKTWTASQLSAWLERHGIPIPQQTYVGLQTLVEEHWNDVSPWSYDQYITAQKVFADLHEPTFSTWDESHLREFLLKQGIVTPKAVKDELVVRAYAQYRAYTDASAAYASPTITTIPGVTSYQPAASISSLTARVTDVVMRTLDDSKDYVYSTWDDNRLREYLESHGVQLKEKAQKSRHDLLSMMHDAYAKVTQPAWDAWSDSYLHEWLVTHHILSPKPPAPYSREYLIQKMSEYYYDANDKVYHTWSESQLRDWLMRNGVIKSDAQLKREKLLNLVDANYLSAKSTILESWSDSAIRDWLVEHNYIDNRNVVQKSRDELISLIQDKISGMTTPSYFAWPDARLRAYLREHNMSEAELPLGRTSLLQEVRVRWVQTQTMWNRVCDLAGDVEGAIQTRLGNLWVLLTGQGHHRKDMKRAAGEKYEQAKEKYRRTGAGVKQSATEMTDEGLRQAKETYEAAMRQAEEQYEKARDKYVKVKGTAEETAKGAAEEAGRKYHQAEKAYEAGKERVYDKGRQVREDVGEQMKAAGETLKVTGEKVKP